MALEKYLMARLAGAGFRRVSSDTYLRGPNAERIEHAVMLDQLRGVNRGRVNVAAGVRHRDVEACLGEIFRRADENWLGNFIARNRCWTIGVDIGTARDHALMWDSIIRRPDDGAVFSIARVAEQMDGILSLRDIHRIFLATAHDRRSSMWRTDGLQNALRHLITREFLRTRGVIADDPDEINQIRTSLERDQDPAYVRMLSIHSFDDLRRIVLDIVR